MQETYKCQSCKKNKVGWNVAANCCLVHVNYDVQPPSIGEHGYKKGYFVKDKPDNHVKNDSKRDIRCDGINCRRFIPLGWIMIKAGKLRFCIGCEKSKHTDIRIVGMQGKNPSREYIEFLELAMDNPEFVEAFKKFEGVKNNVR